MMSSYLLPSRFSYIVLYIINPLQSSSGWWSFFGLSKSPSKVQGTRIRSVTQPPLLSLLQLSSIRIRTISITFNPQQPTSTFDIWPFGLHCDSFECCPLMHLYPRPKWCPGIKQPHILMDMLVRAIRILRTTHTLYHHTGSCKSNWDLQIHCDNYMMCRLIYWLAVFFNIGFNQEPHLQRCAVEDSFSFVWLLF